jgi:hypothetical protein
MTSFFIILLPKKCEKVFRINSDFFFFENKIYFELAISSMLIQDQVQDTNHCATALFKSDGLKWHFQQRVGYLLHLPKI